jgi:O-antigen ligase
LTVAMTDSSAPLEPQRIVRRRAWPQSSYPALAFLAVLILPSASYVGHGLVAAWLLYAAWLLLWLLENPRLIRGHCTVLKARRIELLLFGGWFLVVVCNWLLGRGYTADNHSQVTVTLAMLIVMDLAYDGSGRFRREALTVAVFLLLGTETIRSLPVLWASPRLVRQVIIQGGGAKIYGSAALAGVGVYGFYTACAIVSPVLFATALKGRRWLRGLLVIAWSATAAAIVLSSLMGAVLLLLVGFAMTSVLAVWSVRRKLRIIAGLVFVGILGMVVWTTVLSRTDQGRLISEKMALQTASVLEFGLLEGDLTGRAPLWRSSARTFSENPLFGIGPTTGTDNADLHVRVGGHSSWLDLPAEYGIVGLVFYGGFLVALVRRVWMVSRKDKNHLLAQARVAACLLWLLAGSYNPVTFQIPINAVFFMVALGGTAPAGSSRKTATSQRQTADRVERDDHSPLAPVKR